MKESSDFDAIAFSLPSNHSSCLLSLPDTIIYNNNFRNEISRLLLTIFFLLFFLMHLIAMLKDALSATLGWYILYVCSLC